MRVKVVGCWPSALARPLFAELANRGVTLLRCRTTESDADADLLYVSEFTDPKVLPSDRPTVMQCWHGTATRQWELTAALPGSLLDRLRRLWQLGFTGHGRGLRQRIAESAWLTQTVGGAEPRIWLAPSSYAAAHLIGLGVPSERVRLILTGWHNIRLGPHSQPGGPGSRRRAVRQRLGWPDRLVAVLVSLSVVEPLAEVERERLPRLADQLRAELASWPRPTVMRLVLVPSGDFTARPRWLRRVSRWGLADWLDWAEPTTDPADLLAAGDVFLSLAQHDPLGEWAIGALAWQTPCVLSQFCGPSDALDEGRNGFVLAEPTDTNEAADRLLRLAETSKRFRFRTGLADVAADLHPARWAEDVLLAFSEAVRSEVRQRSRQHQPPT